MNRRLLTTVSVSTLSIALGGSLSVMPISKALAQQLPEQSTDDVATLKKDIAKLRAENAALRERDRLLRENMKLRDRERMDREALGGGEQSPENPTARAPRRNAAAPSGPLTVVPETGVPVTLVDYAGGPPDEAFKAPLARPGKLNIWAEGGAVWSGGDPLVVTSSGIISGLPANFSLVPKVGWDVDSGFDYRFADSLWHVGADVQYGQSRVSNSAATSLALSESNFVLALSQAATGTDDETHWLADFTVGRDLGVGKDAMEIKGGIRIAQITADTGDSGNLSATETATGGAGIPTVGGGTTHTLAISELGNEMLNSSFFGAGPVIGAQGAAPIWGPLELDYRADGAVLIGDQRLVQTTTSSLSISPAVATTTVPFSNTGPTVLSNKTVGVFNGDIEAGLAYWVNPHLKVTASYRLDAFFGALRTVDASGNVVNVDRYYQGPRLGLNATF